MTLRGKDYCNCEHAHMLREAIEKASTLLATPGTSFSRVVYAQQVLDKALTADHDACLDLWGDLQTAKECERIIK